MRIAHITATFPPYRGGTGNVCYHNARELVRRGHSVQVLTALGTDAPANEMRDGITIRRLQPWLRIGNAPLLPQLREALSEFDLLHLHYPFFGGELTLQAARRYNIPLVITYHQDVLLHGLMGVCERMLRSTIERALLRSAQRVLFTSQDYGLASYARPLLAGREGQIGELPNGVDIETFTPGERSTQLRTRYRLGRGDQVALLVAGLDRAHYFKGVAVFLQALTRLPEHIKGIIVGDGDLRSSYERTAAEYGLAERVHFAGRVSDSELPDYYRLADVTVLPSTTMGEAFGLVLVESLACGTPAVASNLPGVRTVISPERDGLLVPPGNAEALAAALGSILADEEQRAAMGASGRQKVEQRYSWATIGAQLEGIYTECRAQHTQGAAA